jgi:hypothetical protein
MVNKIPGSAEHWESGKLGLNNATAKVVTQAEAAAVDRAAGLNMHPISIRLPVELISQMKEIAEHHGIGYQPLIRDVIQRWAVNELSAIYEVRATKARKRKVDMERATLLSVGREKGHRSERERPLRQVLEADARWTRHLSVDHLDQHHDLRRSRRAGYPLKKGLKVPGRAW